MEDLIGFFIIAASIIISIISSVSKNKKKNNTAVPQQDTVQDAGTTQNFNTEPEPIRGTVDSADMTVAEKVKELKAKKYSDYERQKEKEQEQEEEEEQEQEQEHEPQNQQELNGEYSETTDEEHKISKEKKRVAREYSRQKAKRETRKRKSKKKSRIEEIQEDFDVEKGILYSEILNKKHF
ncbi:MAG: hypothetical protein ACQESJ_05715 [Bacteroidota bacterium]